MSPLHLRKRYLLHLRIPRLRAGYLPIQPLQAGSLILDIRNYDAALYTYPFQETDRIPVRHKRIGIAYVELRIISGITVAFVVHRIRLVPVEPNLPILAVIGQHKLELHNIGILHTRQEFHFHLRVAGNNLLARTFFIGRLIATATFTLTKLYTDGHRHGLAVRLDKQIGSHVLSNFVTVYVDHYRAAFPLPCASLWGSNLQPRLRERDAP